MLCFWAIKSKDDENDRNIIRIGNSFDHKVHAILYRVFNNQGFNSKIETIRLCKKIKMFGINIIQLHNLHSIDIDIVYFFGFCKKNRIDVNNINHDCCFFTGLCPHFYPYNKCMQWKDGCLQCPIKETKLFQRQVRRNYKEKMAVLTDIGDLLYITSGTRWIYELGKQSFLSCTPNHLQINDWVDFSVFKKSSTEDIFAGVSPEIRDLILPLMSQIESLKNQLDNTVAVKDAEIAHLKEVIETYQRMLFGSKSEKTRISPKWIR